MSSSISTVVYKPNFKGGPNPASFPIKQHINNGITKGYYGMPQKFRGADGTSSFSKGREIYARSVSKEKNILELQGEYSKKSIGGKPVGVQDSELYIQRKKNIAIGKGSIPGPATTQTDSTLSFKTQYKSNLNTIKMAKRRVRNLGYVPPPKCNHLYG